MVSKVPGTDTIQAAAVLHVGKESEKRVCSIDFIRVDNDVEALVSPSKRAKKNPKPKPAKKKPERPVPAFMAALAAKLGPKFDKLVLQVHSNNAHAQDRFTNKYGFVRAELYDDSWRTKGKKYVLLGMEKEPKGKWIEVARVRRQKERKQQERERKARKEEEEDAIVEPVDAIAARRPRRASAMDVTYAEPEDIPVTVHDLC